MENYHQVYLSRKKERKKNVSLTYIWRKIFWLFLPNASGSFEILVTKRRASTNRLWSFYQRPSNTTIRGIHYYPSYVNVCFLQFYYGLTSCLSYLAVTEREKMRWTLGSVYMTDFCANRPVKYQWTETCWKDHLHRHCYTIKNALFSVKVRENERTLKLWRTSNCFSQT